MEKQIKEVWEENAALKATVARLTAPVTDAEWQAIPKLMAGRNNYSSRDEVDALILARASLADPFFAAAPDLYNGCNALLGLIQLVCSRDDMPPAIREALTTSHRIQEAKDALSKVKP